VARLKDLRKTFPMIAYASDLLKDTRVRAVQKS